MEATTDQRPVRTGDGQEGREEGLLQGIEVTLPLKFGDDSSAVLDEIRRIKNADSLQAILEAIQTAKTLDELRQVISSLNGKQLTRIP